MGDGVKLQSVIRIVIIKFPFVKTEQQSTYTHINNMKEIHVFFLTEVETWISFNIPQFPIICMNREVAI